MWMQKYDKNYEVLYEEVNTMRHKEFGLKGYDGTFNRVGRLNKYNNMYMDKVKNNAIIFIPQKRPCITIESIVGCINQDPYDHLIEVLNKLCNVVVFWSQQEGCGSDYIIMHNGERILRNCKNHTECIRMLVDDYFVMHTELVGAQYAELVNGEVYYIYSNVRFGEYAISDGISADVFK